MIKFLRVKDNQQKVQVICETVLQFYLEKESILIKVANPNVARYVDQLLWRYPPDSFLPHVISDRNTEAKVVISTKGVNFNQAKSLFNLSPEVFADTSSFGKIYELYDETDADKQRLSEVKFRAYQNRGLPVEI